MSRNKEQLAWDVIFAVQLIEQYVGGYNKSGFIGRPHVQDAVSFRLMVIGEAAGDLLDYHGTAFEGVMVGKYEARIFLKLFRRMRDKLIHHHWNIDAVVLFETALTDVPELRMLMYSLRD